MRIKTGKNIVQFFVDPSRRAEERSGISCNTETLKVHFGSTCIHSAAGLAAAQWPGRPPPSSLYRGRPRGCQSRLRSELRRWETRAYIMTVDAGLTRSRTGCCGCVKDGLPATPATNPPLISHPSSKLMPSILLPHPDPPPLPP